MTCSETLSLLQIVFNTARSFSVFSSLLSSSTSVAIFFYQPNEGSFNSINMWRIPSQVSINNLTEFWHSQKFLPLFSLFFPFLPRFSRSIKQIPNLLISRWSTLTRYPIYLVPHALIGVILSPSMKLSVKSTKPSSSCTSSLKDLSLFVLLLHNIISLNILWYHLSILRFHLPIGFFIVSASWSQYTRKVRDVNSPWQDM